MSGSAGIQLIESSAESGINHHGFVTDNVVEVAAELLAKDTEILREIRDAADRFTTLFVRDCKGPKMEVRMPR